MKRHTLPSVTLAFAGATALVLTGSLAAYAATAIGLGTAGSFAVLAGAGITNTGPTTITVTSGRSRRRARRGSSPSR